MLVLAKVKDENGLNAIVEASFSGVAVRSLRERVKRSSASQICVRRLQVCLSVCLYCLSVCLSACFICLQYLYT